MAQAVATPNPNAFDGGFADPVFDAQAVFAAILDAMAHPGRIVDLGHRCRPPEPLSPAQGAFLACLADGDTPVHVEGATPDLAGWLGFQTGASLVAEDIARFAVLKRFERAALERFSLGTLSYPDRSATILVELGDLERGEHLRLEGPGIDGHRDIRLEGAGPDFVETRRRNLSLSPCGLDLVLTCGSRLMALPRSTRVSKD